MILSFVIGSVDEASLIRKCFTVRFAHSNGYHTPADADADDGKRERVVVVCVSFHHPNLSGEK
jgi:hypothetical protein